MVTNILVGSGSMEILLLILTTTLVATLSPLLTFAHLWQIKEWRVDRLLTHLQEEGWLRQVFGVVRPLVILVFLCLALFFQLPSVTRGQGMLPTWPEWMLLALLALDLLFCLQLLLGRQPRTVWTMKATVLVTASLLLDTLIVVTATMDDWHLVIFSPLLVLLQPFILALTYGLFWPVDHFLKLQIIRRATTLREQFPDLTVIGITGSVGKTTTKELLAHILAERHPIVTPAHMNADIGIARWLIRELEIANCELRITAHKNAPNESPITNRKSQILIAEMGAYRSGEIALLCRILKPSIGIITFIGTQHLALFGSAQALCKAKAELFDALPLEGHAFLNADSVSCAHLRDHCHCPVTTVGTGGISDVKATDIEEVPTGISFKVDGTRFVIPLHGTHNVTNVLLAIACAMQLGVMLETIAQRLLTFAPPSRTFQVREDHGVRILDDTHNSSAASFKAAIAWARTQPENQKILLCSGLIELGEEQERTHAELGAFASGIFQRAIFLHLRSGEQFAKGFGNDVEILSKKNLPVPPGSLLVCVGRMGPEVIRRLLSVASVSLRN